MSLNDKPSEYPNLGYIDLLLEFMEIARLFGIFKSALSIEGYLRAA